MDLRSWKKVILQWVTECSFTERNYFNIEQSDIDLFYQKFCTQHPKTVNGKYKRISDFLKEFYPNFDFHLDDTNCLSSADYIYTYSIFLHFCCVRYPETQFHEICQRLPESTQQYIASFFKELIDIESLGKETLRHAIARVSSSNITPPRCNQSAVSNSQSQSSFCITINSSGTSETSTGGSLPSPNYIRCDSPSKTPKRIAAQQRVSPTTPKSFLLEERTRELYNLRAQLETERYEKGLLEVQIKQNEDKILKSNQEHKKLIQQIQDCKNDYLLKVSEGNVSSNRDGEDQISKRLLKEITQKENDLTKLTDLLQTQRDENSFTQEKLNYAEKQIVLCMKRINDLDCKVDELNEEVEQKKEAIKYLTDNKLELEQFIRDTRAIGGPADLNSSSECFDSSFVRNIGPNGTSSSVSSPENLGVSVVDVQLREKEHENCKLKEELELVKDEHKKLAKNLHDLTQKQAKEFNIVIKPSPLNSKESERNKSSKEDPLEQLNLFFCCMEKISTYHKFDKQKIKELEDENLQLKTVNKELTEKLSTLTNEMATYKQKMESVELINADLLKSKADMQLSLDASNLEIEQLRLHKDEILFELKEIKGLKDALTTNFESLQNDLLLSQKCNRALQKSNDDQTQDMETQIELLRKNSEDKIKDTDLEIKRMSQRLIQQAEEINSCISAERSLKLNYEKTLVENEQLKQKAREANTHLQQIKQDLVGKQNDIDKLAKEISEFEEKKKCLEDNIDRIIKKCQEEKIKHEHEKGQLQERIQSCKEDQTNLESKYRQESYKTKQEIDKLQVEISNLQNIIDESSSTNVAKLRETEELQKMLYDIVSPKINNLLKLLNVPAHKEGCLENIRILTAEVECLHQHKIESKILLQSLEMQEEHSCMRIQQLSNNLEEKNKSLVLITEECAQLRQKCNDYESTIETLQAKQQEFMEKVKDREQELSDSMRLASKEYEDSLERIHVELKRQNEIHNERERELLLVISEHNDVKKRLNEKELELEKLSKENSFLLQQNEIIQMLESRAAEYSEKNEKLKTDINSFKHEVRQNATRLSKADDTLNDLMNITKDYNLKTCELRQIKELLEEKEIALQHGSKKQKDLELELKTQKETVLKLTDHLKFLEDQKNQQVHDIEDYINQIHQVQEEKSLLLKSLEKSADQLKLSMDEKQIQINSLEQKYKDVKEQMEAVTMQNTQLQADLVEREAELRLSQEDHEQEIEKHQQEIKQLHQQLAESSEQLQAFDMSLLEILVKMENNFNLSKELDTDDGFKNVFNSQQLQEKEDKLQRLRHNLNRLLYFDRQLQSQLGELNLKLEEQKTISESSNKSLTDLKNKLKLKDIDLKELRVQLENEEVNAEKRVSLEICRLQNDLQNLEKVNDQLSNGNVEMQEAMENLELNLQKAKSELDEMKKEKDVLHEDICAKNRLLEKQKNEAKRYQQSLKDKGLQLETYREKYKMLEALQKEKTVKVEALEKELQTIKDKSIKQQQKIALQQQQMESLVAEQKKVQENFKNLQTCNEGLENEIDVKSKEIMCCKSKIKELLQKNKNSENQLELTIKKLDESEAAKINNETKCERMLFEAEQLRRDIEFLKSQQQSAVDESQRLTSEMESIKQDKQHLRDEIRDTKTDLQRANDNVSHLIQQISSIRLEKESVAEENNLLKKQLDETGKNHSSSETKLKSILERSQDFERKLLTAENELKAVKDSLEKSELNIERLTSENKKLKLNHETATKRIDKMASKLQDSQARCTKLERDNEKLVKTLEANGATVEALQKEKDLLQNEAISLKERVLRAERSHEQLASTVQNLEDLNCQLQETKQKLEASGIDGQSKLTKLEKVRESHEEKIRRLSNALNNSENSNVKLTLEIGGLNSQLEEMKAQNKNELLQDLQRQLETVQQQCSKHEELTVSQQAELDALKEEKSTLSDRLSKAQLSLKISNDQCTELTTEVEQLRSEILTMRDNISRAEKHEKAVVKQLQELELKCSTLFNEREASRDEYNARLISLEEKLSEKCEEVKAMEQEIYNLQENGNAYSALIMQHSENQSQFEDLEKLRAKNQSQSEDLERLHMKIQSQSDDLEKLREKNQSQSEDLEKLRVKLSMADETLAREQENISQLQFDNQILHTKYKESKQKALDAAKISEERIKENRLELESKLEKMKNKMDGPHSFDDSMSALLSTTAGGTRKKCTGVTHYKRPGPPTPSKNGRLSFGGVGSSEPAREILKESFGSNAVSSSKTPARFTFFSSRFSMGNAKDENNPINSETKESNLQKNINTGQHNKYICKNHGVVCTSTPRKSREFYDKRQLLKQLLTSSPSPSPLPVQYVKLEKKMSPPDLSIIETPLTSFPTYIKIAKAPTRKQTTTKRLEAIATGLKNRRRNSSAYGRRLSRRMEEICTPTSGETTSSAALSNTPKNKKLIRRQTINSLTTTTSDGMSEKAALRSRHAKPKPQNEKAAKARPSLHLAGNMFVKYRAPPSKRAQHKYNTQKSRKQRKDHFNEGRNLKLRETDDTSEEENEETMIRNLTYDIKNNNFAPPSKNRNSELMYETLVLKKGHSHRGIEKDIKAERFTNATEMFESMDAFLEKEHANWSPYNVDDSEDEYNKESITHNAFKTDKYDKKYESKYCIKKDSCKRELVSSFELEEFDRLISKSNKNEENIPARFSSNGSSVYFEKLLLKNESNAPFPIKPIDCRDSLNNSARLETFGSSSEMQSQYDVSTATPHISPGGGTTTGHSSRTIYGSTIIYNRRLPNINTTYARKSSIYMRKNNDNLGGCDHIVLITNETITLVDIARMWWQMDNSTRFIVSFAAMASVFSVLGICLSFWAKH